MLAFAIDHPIPATIILITGDRDYAYAVSTLKLRKYQVILVVPSSPHTSPSLESQASLVIDWGAALLRTRSDSLNSSQAVRQPHVGVDAKLVAKLLRELQDSPLDDPDATVPPSSNASQTTTRLRRISTRDLLESSRHCKNTGSLDSTQEFTHDPASPRKPPSTGNDPTPGGLPIPKTPSRSRRASINTGSTRVHGTTVVAQSPPAVEWDIPAKNPPPSSASRLSASDIADVVGPAKRSPSVVPSLDTALELPLNHSCPPSSIIVRSPLGADQSMSVSGKPTSPPRRNLNYQASPFVMPRALTGVRSIPSSCTQQSLTIVGPTSTILTQAKPLSETVTGVGDTERLNGSRIEDNDTNSGRFILHPTHFKEGSRDATGTPKLNDHPYWHVVPATSFTDGAGVIPSSGNVGVNPTDTPLNKHVFLRDGDDLEFAVYSPVPGSEPALSSSAFPSPPSSFTTTQSDEHDDSTRRDTWAKFKPLIDVLLAARERGIHRPTRSEIALDLVQSCQHVYQRAGVSRFRDYSALAEEAGMIELGGIAGGAWIALHPNWFNADGVATTPFFANRVSSPTFNPPPAIPNPLLASPKTPLTQRIFQSPSFAFCSPKNSNTFPTSPIGRQDVAPRAYIPAPFQPLIDALIRTRAEGHHQTLRSVVGQLLGPDVYARAGVTGFKEYILQALEAQLVQCGGDGGHAWICLHPGLRM